MSNKRQWTTKQAEETLDAVLEKKKIRAKAYLIRFGTNAIYHIPDLKLVIRISRPGVDLNLEEKQYNCVEYLIGEKIDLTPPAREHEPIIVDKSYISFWKYVEPSVSKIDYNRFGSLVKKLHETQYPHLDELLDYDLTEKIQRRLNYLENSEIASEDDMAFLKDYFQKISKCYQKYTSKLGVGLIHGDAHSGNVIQNPENLYLCDFDYISRGPRELDLVAVLQCHTRFGVSQEDYDAYCEGYGYDLREQKNYRDLLNIRDLSSFTWLYQNKGLSDKVDYEIDHRMKTLRSGDLEAKWKPY